MTKRVTTSGFTLIELLVVIAIIGVLSALLLTNFVGIRERGADSSLKSNARSLKTALRLYYNDFQKFPSGSGGALLGCGTGTVAVPPSDPCTAGSVFAANGTEYMKQLPQSFEYYSDGGQTFLILMVLANASDADIAASQTRCAPGSRSYYGGTPGDNDYFVCED